MYSSSVQLKLQPGSCPYPTGRDYWIFKHTATQLAAELHWGLLSKHQRLLSRENNQKTKVNEGSFRPFCSDSATFRSTSGEVAECKSQEQLASRKLSPSSGFAKGLNQCFPNLFRPRAPWLHKPICSAPYSTLLKAFLRTVVCTAH